MIYESTQNKSLLIFYKITIKKGDDLIQGFHVGL